MARNTIVLGRLVVATSRIAVDGAPRLDQALIVEASDDGGRRWAGVAIRLWGTRVVSVGWRGLAVHDRHLHPVRHRRARRRQRRERLWLAEHAGIPGTHLVHDVSAPPDVLPPSAAIPGWGEAVYANTESEGRAAGKAFVDVVARRGRQ